MKLFAKIVLLFALLIFPLLLILGSFFVYADENKTENIFYEGPWQIESFKEIGKIGPYIVPDQKHGYIFTISPDEKWLATLANTDVRDVYIAKIFYIPKRRYYERKFKFEPKHDPKLGIATGLEWRADCFTEDSTAVFLGSYMIPLSENMQSLTIKEEPELYKKIKPKLTSLDQGKHNKPSSLKILYASSDWAFTRDGKVLYESGSKEGSNQDNLQITPPGIIKEIDYSDIIKDAIESQNEWCLRFLMNIGNGKDLFGRAIKDINEVSDDELKQAVRKQDKNFRKWISNGQTEESRSELQKRILSYKKTYNKEEEQFIENIFKNVGDDLSELTKRELIKLKEDIEMGLTKIRRREEKDIEEMPREKLLNELFFVTEPEISISLERLSPSPDGKWLAVIVDPYHTYWFPFTSGNIPYGALINPKEKRLKPIRFAKHISGQMIWSNDSKRLYFYANDVIHRLILKEVK